MVGLLTLVLCTSLFSLFWRILGYWLPFQWYLISDHSHAFHTALLDYVFSLLLCIIKSEENLPKVELFILVCTWLWAFLFFLLWKHGHFTWSSKDWFNWDITLVGLRSVYALASVMWFVFLFLWTVCIFGICFLTVLLLFFPHCRAVCLADCIIV